MHVFQTTAAILGVPVSRIFVVVGLNESAISKIFNVPFLLLFVSILKIVRTFGGSSLLGFVFYLTFNSLFSLYSTFFLDCCITIKKEAIIIEGSWVFVLASCFDFLTFSLLFLFCLVVYFFFLVSTSFPVGFCCFFSSWFRINLPLLNRNFDPFIRKFALSSRKSIKICILYISIMYLSIKSFNVFKRHACLSNHCSNSECIC